MSQDELVEEVTFENGTTKEVVYDPENNLVHARKTVDDLKKEILEGIEGGRIVGTVDAVNWDAYEEAADRLGNDIGSAYVSPSMLRRFARKVEHTGSSTATLTVADELPVVADCGGDGIVVLAPKVDVEEDEEPEVPDYVGVRDSDEEVRLESESLVVEVDGEHPNYVAYADDYTLDEADRAPWKARSSDPGQYGWHFTLTEHDEDDPIMEWIDHDS